MGNNGGEGPQGICAHNGSFLDCMPRQPFTPGSKLERSSSFLRSPSLGPLQGGAAISTWASPASTCLSTPSWSSPNTWVYCRSLLCNFPFNWSDIHVPCFAGSGPRTGDWKRRRGGCRARLLPTARQPIQSRGDDHVLHCPGTTTDRTHRCLLARLLFVCLLVWLFVFVSCFVLFFSFRALWIRAEAWASLFKVRSG